MLEVSERARVAIEAAPAELKGKIKRVFDDLNQHKYRPNDKSIAGRPGMRVSRLNGYFLLFYMVKPEGILIDDVIDKRLYQS